MLDLSLAISQSQTTNRKTRSESAVSMTHANLALLALIVIAGFMYLFQINTLGTRGYEIRQLEQKLKVLQAENKALEIQRSSLTSITKIQQDAEGMGMVPATDVIYIKHAGFALK